MPYTFAHPAAVLPLRRFRRLGFLPLVVGSVAPDLPYYLPQGIADVLPNTHTFAGSILVALPVGIIALVLALMLRGAVNEILWEPHRTLVARGFEEFRRAPRHWLWALPALMIGIWLHLGWDSFTHYDGWMVERSAWLREETPVIGGYSTSVFHLLQYLSSILGMLALVSWYGARVQRARARGLRAPRGDWRPRVLGIMLILATASGLAAAWQSPPWERSSFYSLAVIVLTVASTALAVQVLAVGAVLATNATAQRDERER